MSAGFSIWSSLCPARCRRSVPHDRRKPPSHFGSERHSSHGKNRYRSRQAVVPVSDEFGESELQGIRVLRNSSRPSSLCAIRVAQAPSMRFFLESHSRRPGVRQRVVALPQLRQHACQLFPPWVSPFPEVDQVQHPNMRPTCCSASPGFSAPAFAGQRRFHRNTACARLSGFNRPFTWSIAVRCST